MPYQRTILLSLQRNGPGVPCLYFYNPGSRSRAWIWFDEAEVPAWARDGDSRVVVEKTGHKRPAWRIVRPAD